MLLFSEVRSTIQPEMSKSYIILGITSSAIEGIWYVAVVAARQEKYLVRIILHDDLHDHLLCMYSTMEVQRSDSAI